MEGKTGLNQEGEISWKKKGSTDRTGKQELPK
jgi:hypothetical protein